jgi:hypothetical protein
VIDMLEGEVAPVERELRGYARRQVGCHALIDTYYGIGELTAVTIVAELGDCRRFANSRDAGRYSGLDITVYQSDRRRALGTYRVKARRRCAGRHNEAAQTARRGERILDREYYLQLKDRIGGTAPASRSRARCSSAATTPCAISAMTHWRHRPRRRIRADVAQPRAARVAPVLARPTPRQHRRLPVSWPRDPSFGCALRQPGPAGPEPPTIFQPFARLKPSLTPMRRGRLPNDYIPPRAPPGKIERPQRFPCGITPSTSGRRPIAKPGRGPK